MICFRVEGPFEIKPLHGTYGRLIQKEAIEKFWEENPGCSEDSGCYVFGLRTGGGFTPIYVGQSSNGFKHECFQHHKLTHYNEAIAMHKGTPIMFFVVKDSGPQAIFQTCLDQVEHYLIQLAVQRNPNLANVKRVEWSIAGLFHAGSGHPSASTTALRQMLGIAHPVQPAVQKSPDEESEATESEEQTSTVRATVPLDGAISSEADKEQIARIATPPAAVVGPGQNEVGKPNVANIP